MKDALSISVTEWKIMKVLWEKPHSTALQVHENLEKETGWKPNTVRTLLSRLVTKGAIAYKEDSKSYLYFPRVSEEECIKAENSSFLQKVYNGAMNVMLANFIENNSLSDQDIEKLKQMLEKKKSQKR